MARLTLQDWIGDALVDPDKDGKITMLSLVHLRGMDETDVHTVRFGPGKSWTPKELAQLFRGKAENYAAEIAGVQQFCLYAFYGDSSEPQARKPIMVNGATEHAGLATEGPNKEGMLAQGMRHTEAMVQMCFRQIGMAFDANRMMMQQLMESNSQLVAENRDAYSIIKRMTLEQAQQQASDSMAVATHERNMEIQQTVVRLLPAIVNRVTGREIFPQGTEDTAIIERLVDVLDEEKLIKIMETNTIPNELWGMLMARMEAVQKRRNLNASHAEAELGGDEEEDESEKDDDEDSDR